MKSKNKYALLIFLLLLVGISIGYAALATTLNINGNTTIEKTSWDIHFENLVKTTGSEVATIEASIDQTKTLIEYTVTLQKPGDFYEFTVDVVNNGTIDAMISEVLKKGLTTEQEKYISYTATYSDGVEIQEKDLLKAKGKDRIKVTVKYKDDIDSSDLPSEEQSLIISFQMTYVQADETATEVAHQEKACSFISGGGFMPGAEISCGNQEFYIVSVKGDNIKMLSRCNLDTQTNTQSLTSASTFYDFSKTNYWTSTTTYPAFVYNSNSTLYQYVEAYETYLKETIGIKNVSASLLSLEDLEPLGCTIQSCNPEKYPWITATDYWLGTAFDVSKIYSFFQGNLEYGNLPEPIGIRPIITITRDDVSQ